MSSTTENSEDRFFRLLSTAKNLPEWFGGVSKTSSHSDSLLGIDYDVLVKNEEYIPVQIKSSYRGMKNFVSDRGTKKICVIIVKADKSDEDNLANIIQRLSEWKAKRS